MDTDKQRKCFYKDRNYYTDDEHPCWGEDKSHNPLVYLCEGHKPVWMGLSYKQKPQEVNLKMDDKGYVKTKWYSTSCFEENIYETESTEKEKYYKGFWKEYAEIAESSQKKTVELKNDYNIPFVISTDAATPVNTVYYTSSNSFPQVFSTSCRTDLSDYKLNFKKVDFGNYNFPVGT